MFFMFRNIALMAAANTIVNASPMPAPAGVTADIAPKASPPAGCTNNLAGTFGIAVVSVTKSQPSPSASPKPTSPPKSAAMISQIDDGQPQAASVMRAIQQINDGQVQHQTTVDPITQIDDGQIQATYSKVTVKTTVTRRVPVTTISDGQPQAPTGEAFYTSVKTATSSVLATPTPLAKRQTPSIRNVACKSNSTLQLTLAGSVLLDARGRTGYIASNYQFQFDAPAQSGAIYTSGFSVCDDGLLALGGSKTFYQCLSGEFYNLYDRHWAAQCEPVNLGLVALKDC